MHPEPPVVDPQVWAESSLRLPWLAAPLVFLMVVALMVAAAAAF